MLKLPKGLKKKKKGKKSKRKGEEELFTEEELEKYRREHQQPVDAGEPSAKENEEWSKFKDLTTGVDSVLRKTQGDLDRIKSTSFFQRVPAGARQPPPPPPPPAPHQRVATVTAADFPGLAPAPAPARGADERDDASSAPPSDSESEEEQDDIFDTSYVEAVERGEVRLAYVPDSPDEPDDGLFDTSHLDALIKGEDPKTARGKKGLDIGIAVSVLTGRIDNVTVTSKRSKRVIPGDLLLESDDRVPSPAPLAVVSEPQEKSILDTDADIPITTPIDLSVSLHTSLIQQNKNQLELESCEVPPAEEEDDEFTQLAAESLEVSAEVTKFEQKEITVAPVLQESWSVFEADKNSAVFAEGVAEDQIDVIDPYLDQDDPFDTSFADAVVPSAQFEKEAVLLSDDDDFDPRAEENRARLNNRRKSSVRIHLTDPSGVRESITSDDLGDKEVPVIPRDLLGGSSTDLAQLGDSPLDPVDINESEIDPFDTTIVDKIVAPGKIELKLLEQELIGVSPAPGVVYRVPSDPDFDPRAEEPPAPRAPASERRASRPENLVYGKSVVFDVESATLEPAKPKAAKPLTPYYTREVSITEDLSEENEAEDAVPETLTRTRSDEDLAPRFNYHVKRRHSELPQSNQSKSKQKSLLETGHSEIQAKVLTPSEPGPRQETQRIDIDPFDTTFAGELAPTKTELKLLAKEFSCDETNEPEGPKDLLDPSDDIFQIKALTPEPSKVSRLPEEETDPFDTSFASDLQPGKTELKLLESEFLH